MYLNPKLSAWLVLTGCLAAAGCSSGFLGLAPAGDRQEYVQARNLYEKGAYRQAVSELTQYIYKTQNVKRREARAYRLLGLSYERLGIPSKALEVYLEALEFHPHHVALLLEAARLYHETNLINRSIALYEKVLEEEPENLEALAGQGANYAAMGFYSKARQFYEHFFELNPTAPPQYRARYAHTFLSQRNYEQAFIHITMALTENAKNPDFWLLSAKARRGLNQPAAALLDLQTARTLAPQRNDLLAYQALWQYEAGQYTNAQQTTRQILAREPHNALAFFIQALIAKAQGHPQTAARLFHQAARQEPDSFTGQVAARLLNP